MSLLVFKSSYLSCKSHARAPAVSKRFVYVVVARVDSSLLGPFYTDSVSPHLTLLKSRSDQKVAKNQIKSQQNKNPFSWFFSSCWNANAHATPAAEAAQQTLLVKTKGSSRNTNKIFGCDPAFIYWLLIPNGHNDALIRIYFYSFEAIALILNQNNPQVDVFFCADFINDFVLY